MSDALEIDEHELLDMGAKADIILQGLRYAIVFQDLDIVKKCIIDLQDCLNIMDSIIEDHFGKE